MTADIIIVEEVALTEAGVAVLKPRDRIELPCEASLAAFGAYRC